VLPWWVWVPAWGLALLLMLVLSRRASSPQQVAYRGALGALVLASMSLAVPLGPIEYHLGLLGPVGVLLGGAAAFEVLFIVAGILALIGHGGLTVVGLNALVLAAGATVARPTYRVWARTHSPARSFAAAAAVSQAVAGTLWTVVMLGALGGRVTGEANPSGLHAQTPLVVGVVATIWLLGLVVETTVAFGLGRFLARVKPELLPGIPANWPARAAVVSGQP